MADRSAALAIEARLLREVEQARESYSIANREFDEICNDAPSGIPHPDGSLRITQAGKNRSSARQNYLGALQRWTNFIVDGKVPDDLLPPSDKI
jgi:hypothetical protein